MGNRTVVILNNDHIGTWANEAQLGELIRAGVTAHSSGRREPGDTRVENYGDVVECTHTDHTTLAVLVGTSMVALAHARRDPRQSLTDAQVDLLRQAAEQLGYTLVKK